MHPVFDSIIPMEHEFIPINYEFTEACKSVLEDCGLYNPPSQTQPRGELLHRLLNPKRHMGRCNPGARCNMSPVISEFFAATQSMQNFQVLTSTNGVSRYVTKYITKMDTNNRCTIHADAHTGASMRVQNTFLHNTKITRSAINEAEAFRRSREHNLPEGRRIAVVEMLQQLTGTPEVMTTWNFLRVSTRPFEYRSTTSMRLNAEGRLHRPRDPGDAQSTQSESETIRRSKDFPPERCMRENQGLLFRHTGVKPGAYDRVTQFGLRPVELLELFPRLGNYFRWFHLSDEVLEDVKLLRALTLDVERCLWVDCLGRRVRLRHEAFEEVLEVLEERGESGLPSHGLAIRRMICRMIRRDEVDPDYVIANGGKDLPIVVFSSITPRNPLDFLLHIMLMLGEYETELDFRMQPSMRQSLVLAKLIGDRTDEESLLQYCRDLLKRVLDEVLSVQPISLRKIDEYVVTASELFNGILLRDEIPVTDLPACILTELLNSKEDKLQAFWYRKKNDHLTAIYDMLSEASVPPRKDVERCVRHHPGTWNPLPYPRSPEQSDASHLEQSAAVFAGVRAIDKYSQQFGPTAATAT